MSYFEKHEPRTDEPLINSGPLKTDPRLGWKLRGPNYPHRLSRTEIAISKYHNL